MNLDFKCFKTKYLLPVYISICVTPDMKWTNYMSYGQATNNRLYQMSVLIVYNGLAEV